jgi:DNA-binding ferritin-like protein
MFFGFSRKFGNRFRNKNRNRNRKKKFTARKMGSRRGSNNNNNNNNVKFKIEEIDTPSTPTPRVKTIKTDSTSPIILSGTDTHTPTISRSSSRSRSRSRSSSRSRTTSRSSSGSNTKFKRDIQMRTPTPYHSSDSESKSSSMTTVKSLNSSGDIILFFMDMLTTVKLYHWKTMNYATHKATDELYDDLNKYVDEFVEVLLGYKGGVRAKLPRTQVTLHDCNSIEEFKKKIDGYKNVLIGFTSRFDGKKNSDLLNIRDEILATLNKSLYVMSFK